MGKDLENTFYVAGGLGITKGAAAGGVLIADSIAGTSLMGAGGLATAAGVPTIAGNAVIGMGSAGLIGGTTSVIGGGNFVSGGVTAAPGGLVGGAASSVAASLLAWAGFSGLLGAMTSDGIGGAAAAAVDSRLKGNTLGQTLTASFYGFVTGGTLRAGLHYAGPLVRQWWTAWTPKTSAPSSGPVLRNANPKSLLSRQGPLEMTPCRVQEMSEEMMVQRFPWQRIGPIDVAEGPNAALIILDGHHRTAAAIEAGLDCVPIRVKTVQKELWQQLMAEVLNAAGEL
ncbi:MAG: ParB N-terminal domain-containing protein [Planctomycetaceae bacterium]